MKNKTLYIIFVLLLFASEHLMAQGCSMCKAVAESNVQGGGEEASGLNSGILYIMLFPYILFTLFMFYWRKHRKETKDLYPD